MPSKCCVISPEKFPNALFLIVFLLVLSWIIRAVCLIIHDVFTYMFSNKTLLDYVSKLHTCIIMVFHILANWYIRGGLTIMGSVSCSFQNWWAHGIYRQSPSCWRWEELSSGHKILQRCNQPRSVHQLPGVSSSKQRPRVVVVDLCLSVCLSVCLVPL